MNKLIGFEGIDGSGKTILINKLLSYKNLSKKVIFTTRRNPSSPFVEEMYAAMPNFKKEFKALDLFVEDMFYRYSVMPENKFIFSDRTFTSASIFYETTAEQGNISDSALRQKIQQGLQTYSPLLTIILRVDVDKALDRIYYERGKFSPVEEPEFLAGCSRRFAAIKSNKQTLVIDTSNLTEIEVFDAVKDRVYELIQY